MSPHDPSHALVLDVDDLPALARGCAILGTGGGGSTDIGLAAATQALRTHGPITVRPLSDFPDDALVVPMSGIGAPTVGAEMLAGASDARRLAEEVERVFGSPISAVMSGEIGGSNGLHPIAWATEMGVPLVDADTMGRAFPEVHMSSLYVAGLPLPPIVLCDVLGNVTTVRSVDGPWAERIARAVAVVAGSHALMADYVVTAGRARGRVVDGSVSRALRIGRCTDGAEDPVGALVAELSARRLVSGKIIDIERRTDGGFVRGSVIVEGQGADQGRLLRVELQNENLVAFCDGRVLASAPDLITVVDVQSGAAISTESLRYGQRVTVLAWPCHPLWRTRAALAVVGPRAFGYDLDYVPVEEVHRDR